MIDEKKLIAEINEMVYKAEMHSPVYNALHEVIDLVEHQPKVGEWIPSNQCLPKDDYTTVLVWLDSKIYDIAIWHHKYGFRPWYAEYFNDAPQEWKGSVIAWRPLPEPLRKEENK